MPPSEPLRVFISYARDDGAEYAAKLRERLEKQYSDITLWHDIVSERSGRDWWQQITDALDHVAYMVLVATPKAISSDMVRKEWRYARQNGVCVLPVKASDALDFDSLPRWMKTQQFADLRVEAQWQVFAADLRRPCQTPRVPFMAEDLPADFVQRPDEFEPIVKLLLDEKREQGNPVAITTALRGAGGFGKTTLAKAVCHDERTQETFDDGILWVTLGEKVENLVGKVAELTTVLSGEPASFTGKEAAVTRLRELLADRDILMVIDDVWNPAHLDPFLQGGPYCVRLVTTRNLDTLPRQARDVKVDSMQPTEAAGLLGSGLPSECNPQINTLAKRLGKWPLLLGIVNGVLRERVNKASQPLPEAIADVNQALDEGGLTAFDPEDAEARNRAVDLTVGVSLGLFSAEQRERLQELSIFPEDVDIPLSVVEKLWGATASLKPFKVQELCIKLHRHSLLQTLNLTTRQIRLHDVMRTYLQGALGKRAEEGAWQVTRCLGRSAGAPGAPMRGIGIRDTHRALLASYKEVQESWSSVQSDGYIRDNLLFHVFEAHGEQGIRDFLHEEDRGPARAWATVRSPTEYAVDLETCRRYLRAGASVGIADDFRISLSRSSLRSFSANLPAPLFVALVERGVWSVSRAAEEVSELDDTALRVEVMLALSSLPGAQPIKIMNECIATLPLVSSDRRQKLVQSVATHLCTMHQGARAAQLIEEHCGVRGLEKRRAPFLFESPDAETLMAIEAAIVAHYSEGDVNRAYLLSELGDVAHDVAPEIFARAVREAKRVESTFDRAFVCARLVGHMTSDEQQSMLSSLVDFLMRDVYVDVFAQVAHLIDADTLARVVAASIDKAMRCEDSCRVLELAAPYLKDESRNGLGDALSRHGGASDRGRIAAACARADSARRASHVAEGFAAISSLPDGWAKARCFEDLSKVLEASEFDEARSLLERWSDKDSAPYRDEARRALDKVQTERERPGVTTEERAAGKLNACTDAAAVNRDLERILIGSDLDERRRALASLAPSLSTEQLKRVIANERGIHDVAAIGAALETLEKSLHRSEECHADVTPIRGESFTRGMLPLLEREIGVLSPDWLGRSVARAYAKTGAIRHAFALARKESVDLALRKLAFGDVAALASPEQIEAEWGNRPEDFEAADEAPLLARMSADRIRAIRDEQLGSAEGARRPQYWRQLRRAEFAVFLEDGRAAAIANYLDAFEREVGRRHEVGLLEHECALLEGLSRVMTDSTYDRTIALIRDTRSRLNHNSRRMFLVLAARRGGTLLDEAIYDVGYLDKSERVRVLADAAESCSGDTRARIVKQAVAYARSQDYRPIDDMCIASYVCEPSVRVELLQEALVRCASERNFSHQDARAVAATACCLLPDTDRVHMLQVGLAAAEQLYRPRFLSCLSALQLLLAQTCSPEELRDFKFALSGAAARWP